MKKAAILLVTSLLLTSCVRSEVELPVVEQNEVVMNDTGGSSNHFIEDEFFSISNEVNSNFSEEKIIIGLSQLVNTLNNVFLHENYVNNNYIVDDNNLGVFTKNNHLEIHPNNAVPIEGFSGRKSHLALSECYNLIFSSSAENIILDSFDDRIIDGFVNVPTIGMTHNHMALKDYLYDKNNISMTFYPVFFRDNSIENYEETPKYKLYIYDFNDNEIGYQEFDDTYVIYDTKNLAEITYYFINEEGRYKINKIAM